MPALQAVRPTFDPPHFSFLPNVLKVQQRIGIGRKLELGVFAEGYKQRAKYAVWLGVLSSKLVKPKFLYWIARRNICIGKNMKNRRPLI